MVYSRAANGKGAMRGLRRRTAERRLDIADRASHQSIRSSAPVLLCLLVLPGDRFRALLKACLTPSEALLLTLSSARRVHRRVAEVSLVRILSRERRHSTSAPPAISNSPSNTEGCGVRIPVIPVRLNRRDAVVSLIKSTDLFRAVCRA